MFTACVWAAVALGQPPGGAWPTDALHLRNGLVYRGLILEDTPERVRLQNVRQVPGRPTVAYPITFGRHEIARVERLDDAERAKLQQRLQDLDPQGLGERQRMDRLDLQAVPWRDKPVGGRRYEGEQFTLESNAPEQVVRRAAVRLDQLFGAFRRALPPRPDAAAATPTRIVLVQSREEYETMLRAEGLRFRNTAFYDPATNRVLCASDLERLGTDLESVRLKHTELRADLDRREAALGKLYKGRDLGQRAQPLRDTRKRIEQADARNDEAFAQATRQLFNTLAHEAFHAYAQTQAAPPPRELPRWLNEGLAQLFETALVEAGELRLGHADADRLAKAQEAVRKGAMLPLSHVLRSAGKDYHSGPAGGDSSGGFYLAAWGVAHQLAFERHLLGTPALEQYLSSLAAGGDGLDAFATLVGQPLDKFERDHHAYLLALNPDGSRRK